MENIDERKSQCCRDMFQPIILQSLKTNLESRMIFYVKVDEKFSFLLKLNKRCFEEISESCRQIASFHPQDIDGSELIPECETLFL